MDTAINNKHIIFNAVLFQVVWFAAILGGWYWALLPIVLMLVHLFIIRKDMAVGIVPLLALSLIGVSFDSAFHYAGIYEFSSEALTLPLFGLPLWLVFLWLGFCLTLPVSLAWLIKKPYLFVIGCALLGPVSYLAGRRLEVLSFSDSNTWLLAAEWCVFAIVSLALLFPKLGMSKASSVLTKEESIC